MKYETLFNPIQINKTKIKNRIVMAPMATLGLLTIDGCFGPRAIEYYIARARGGVGLIITGAVKIENEIEKLKMLQNKHQSEKEGLLKLNELL